MNDRRGKKKEKNNNKILGEVARILKTFSKSPGSKKIQIQGYTMHK